jgi:hypothetical protein
VPWKPRLAKQNRTRQPFPCQRAACVRSAGGGVLGL